MYAGAMKRFLAHLLVIGLVSWASAGAWAQGEPTVTPHEASPSQGHTDLAYWLEGDGNTSRSEVVRNAMLVVAAFIGLGLIWRAVTAHRQANAAIRQATAANVQATAANEQATAANEQATAANEQATAANEQARIGNQGPLTKRFSRAVEQLGSDQLALRLDGIFALWRLLAESTEQLSGDTINRDAIAIVDILSAFVRYPTSDRDVMNKNATVDVEVGGGGVEAEVKTPRHREGMLPDVQAILSLLTEDGVGRRDLLPRGYHLDFVGADMRYAKLVYAHMEGARLFDVRFDNSNLMDAHLEGAALIGAHFVGAYLQAADLANANMYGTLLDGAKLEEANLRGANLTGADFSKAEGLAQSQIDAAFYDPKKGNPPRLPAGLNPPPPRPEEPGDETD